MFLKISTKVKKNQTNAKFSVRLFNISTHLGVWMHPKKEKHYGEFVVICLISRNATEDCAVGMPNQHSVQTRLNLFHPIRGSALHERLPGANAPVYRHSVPSGLMRQHQLNQPRRGKTT